MRRATATSSPILLTLLLLVAPTRATGEAISHWAFDETSGDTANDDVGSHDGTLLGGAAFASGQGIRDGAVRVNDSLGASVSMGDVLATDEYPVGQFSISVWFRADLPAPNEQWIVSKHTAGFLNGYALAIGSNGGTGGAANRAWLYVSSLPGALPISTTQVNDGRWHHLVGVYDPVGHTVKIYVDGVLEDTNVESVHVDNTASFRIGGVGLVDELSFHDEALSDEQVAALYFEFYLFQDGFEELGGHCVWSATVPPCV